MRHRPLTHPNADWARGNRPGLRVGPTLLTDASGSFLAELGLFHEHGTLQRGQLYELYFPDKSATIIRSIFVNPLYDHVRSHSCLMKGTIVGIFAFFGHEKCLITPFIRTVWDRNGDPSGPLKKSRGGPKARANFARVEAAALESFGVGMPLWGDLVLWGSFLGKFFL